MTNHVFCRKVNEEYIVKYYQIINNKILSNVNLPNNIKETLLQDTLNYMNDYLEKERLATYEIEDIKKLKKACYKELSNISNS